MADSAASIDIAALSDDKAHQVYSLVEMMPAAAVRAAFLGRLRTHLRRLRPPRRSTPLRLFCQPFEPLLCNRVPKASPQGCVPRAVLQPLWTLLRPHLRDGGALERLEALPLGAAVPPALQAALHTAFETALAGLRTAAAGDPALAAHGTTIRPDFWQVVSDIQAVYLMRGALDAAALRIAAARMTGDGGPPCPTEAASCAKAVAALALDATDGGRQRRRLMIFLLCLVLDDDDAPDVGGILDALAAAIDPADCSAVDEVCATVATREGERIDRLLRIPMDTPEELLAASAHVQQTLDGLRTLRSVAQRQGRRLSHRVREAQRRVRDFLEERFLAAVADTVRAFAEAPDAALPSDAEVEGIAHTVLALSRVQAAARDLQLDATYDAQVERVRARVQTRIARALARHRDDAEPAKRTALSAAAGAVRSLEPVCPPDDLVAMLEACAGQAGVALGASRDRFLVAFVRYVDAGTAPDGAADPALSTGVPGAGAAGFTKRRTRV